MQDVSAQILEAAFRCLAQKGSAAVSLRDIAREAGVALSQLHYYFGSRDHLLSAAAVYVMRQQTGQIQALLAATPDPAERIRLAIGFIRQQLRQDPAWAKVLLDLLSMAAWSPALAEANRRLQEELLALILLQSEQTGVARLQSKTVARLVLGALDGLALQALQGAPEEEMDAAYAALEWLLTDLVKQ